MFLKIWFSVLASVQYPNRTFHSFRGSTIDQRVLSSSESSCDGFWSSKVVKVSVEMMLLLYFPTNSQKDDVSYGQDLDYIYAVIPARSNVLSESKKVQKAAHSKCSHHHHNKNFSTLLAWTRLSIYIFSTELAPVVGPDRTFTNFRTSRYVDRLFWIT